MSKSGFDKPLGIREAPRLSEYKFNVDAATIVSAIAHQKDQVAPTIVVQSYLERS